MFRVTARITAHEGKENELKTSLMELVKACAHHKGLHAYRLHQNTKIPTEFLFYEQFESESCFTAHSQSPEIVASQKKRLTLTASSELDFWTPLAESGSNIPTLDTFLCLHTRRSVRSFTNEPISDDQAQQILEAAMAAPSASDRQTWEFILIRNADSFKHIMHIHPYASMLEQASLAILVCGNLQKEKTPGFWVQNCSAATQNILLAARALGIGSTWCGVHPVEKLVTAFQEYFALPEHIVPLGLVVLGMPTEAFSKRNTFDASKIHIESFTK